MKYSSKILSTLLFGLIALVALSCSKAADSSSASQIKDGGQRSSESSRRSAPEQTNGSSQPASQPGLISPILPDSKMTPGDTLNVTKDDICVSGYSKKVRDVPQAVKEEAYREYGVTKREPGEYEIDHLISLELGGSNSLKNLWPESYRTEPWNARVKDKLENRLHEMICSNQIDLKTAQQAIATNWIDTYKKYMGGEPSGGSSGNKDRINQTGSSRDTSTSRQSQNASPNSSNSTNDSTSAGGSIVGNKNSHVYHLPGCPGYDKISEKNRIEFQSSQEAESSGYHLAGNCHQK